MKRITDITDSEDHVTSANSAQTATLYQSRPIFVSQDAEQGYNGQVAQHIHTISVSSHGWCLVFRFRIGSGSLLLPFFAQVAAIAYQNKEVVYNILFQATAQTLRTIGADPKHLGAEIGFIAILHTWVERLERHAFTIEQRQRTRKWPVGC